MIGKAATGGESSIKLLDLGCKNAEIAAVTVVARRNFTMAGQVLGTPYYMSPESGAKFSRDGNPEIDGRTDIYKSRLGGL